MTATQTQRSSSAKRGVLARPMDALVFLLPLLIYYELFSVGRPEGLIAYDLMRRFLELFGRVSVWAPGLAVVIILLATHAASGEQWKIHWREVGFMYVEAAGLALPLLLLNWMIPLAAVRGAPGAITERLALTIGAGIYEELVFRLVLISLVILIFVDLLKFDRTIMALLAIGLSAAAFSAHHYRPFGSEPFRMTSFLFRVLAGGYLATIFWFRGYGPAAGCHAAHNAALVILNAAWD